MNNHIRESIRQTYRASNQDNFEDERLTISELIILWVGGTALIFGWLQVFFWALEK